MPRLAGSPSLAKRLGARIRALRLEAGVKQETLAWECGLDKGFVSQVESGKRLPSVPVLVKLARRIGVEVADLAALDRKNPRLRVLDAMRRMKPAEQEDLAREVEGRRR